MERLSWLRIVGSFPLNVIALQKAGLYPKLVQAALSRGIRGPQDAGIEKQFEALSPGI
jgi:hypothetical protein